MALGGTMKAALQMGTLRHKEVKCLTKDGCWELAELDLSPSLLTLNPLFFSRSAPPGWKRSPVKIHQSRTSRTTG